MASFAEHHYGNGWNDAEVHYRDHVYHVHRGVVCVATWFNVAFNASDKPTTLTLPSNVANGAVTTEILDAYFTACYTQNVDKLVWKDVRLVAELAYYFDHKTLLDKCQAWLKQDSNSKTASIEFMAWASRLKLEGLYKLLCRDMGSSLIEESKAFEMDAWRTAGFGSTNDVLSLLEQVVVFGQRVSKRLVIQEAENSSLERRVTELKDEITELEAENDGE